MFFLTILTPVSVLISFYLSLSILKQNMDMQEEEPCQLLQQPLSLGYYVSTAKTGKLPKWFWNCCQHLEDCNPSFLKVSLVIWHVFH